MALYERTQKILAGAVNYHAYFTGFFNSNWWQQCFSSFHLLFILIIMNSKQRNSDPVKTVLVITVGFLIVYLVTKWPWAIKVSIFIGLLGLLSGYIAKKIDFFWMKLTWVLSFIIPNILLTVIFYFFLTPLALLSGLFGNKNQLTLKNTERSLFNDRKKDFDKASFEKPW
jgi:hypothetical protein